MKTETIVLYDTNELSAKALEKAHTDYLHIGFEYFWLDESLSSVRVFLDFFNAKLSDYSLGTYGYSYLKSDIEQSNVRGLKVKDLPKRDAEITGYCLDGDLLYTFHDYLKKHGDMLGAVKEALDKALTVIIQDMEHQESLEYFKEHSDLNEWVYLENGQVWY